MTDDPASTSFSQRDAYAILGIDRDSDDAAISVAYHRLARRYHPDVAGESATVRMSRINAAFDRIKTPARRAAYDLELARSAPVPAPARAATPTTSPTPAAPPGAAPTYSPTAVPTYRPTSASTPAAASARPDPGDGTGGAGAPPGRPSGSVLRFGRHLGWSIGEIARVDPGYLVWLEERREGQPYREEIDRTLRHVGFRTGTPAGKSKG